MADLTINTSVDANLIESLQYSAPVSSKLINANSYKVKDAGIYYGGFIDGSEVTPFVAEVSDTNGLSYQLHIETKAALTIPTWNNNQDLFLTWTWNAADIAHVILKTGTAGSNDVIIASKDSVGSINYSKRHVPASLARRPQRVNNSAGTILNNKIALPDCSYRASDSAIIQKYFAVWNWTYTSANAGVEFGYDLDGNFVIDYDSKEIPFILGSAVTASDGTILSLREEYEGCRQLVASPPSVTVSPYWKVYGNTGTTYTTPSQFSPTWSKGNIVIPTQGNIQLHDAGQIMWAWDGSGALFEMEVIAEAPVTIPIKIWACDDYLYCYINGTQQFSQSYYRSHETPRSKSMTLRAGRNIIQFVHRDVGSVSNLCMFPKEGLFNPQYGLTFVDDMTFHTQPYTVTA